ncbi:MAG: hypothetical protein ACFFCD_16990 [Promethearchaeota archaeon]
MHSQVLQDVLRRLVLARDHNSAIMVLQRSTYYAASRSPSPASSSGQELPVEPA